MITISSEKPEKACFGLTTPAASAAISAITATRSYRNFPQMKSSIMPPSTATDRICGVVIGPRAG